jgi:hypothetical protein
MKDWALADRKTDETTLCPQCGTGVRIDEDGCCATCGATTCTVAEAEAMLTGHGMHFVSAKEKSAYELFIPQDWAVLFAMQDVSDEALDDPPPGWEGLAEAEKDRRKAKPRR